MKKLILLFCAAALVFSFAACGGKEASSSKALSSAGSGPDITSSDLSEELVDSTATESADENSSVAGGNIGSSKPSGAAGASSKAKADYSLDTAQEKKFASLKGTTATVVGNPETKETADRVKLMKDKYGITINLVKMEFTEMQQKIAAMVAARNAPDLLTFAEVVAMRFVYSNIAQPLDNYLVKDDPMWSYHGRPLLNQVNNKVYWVSSYMDQGWYVYYNKTYFKELKIKEPYDYYKEGAWNFANFRKAAKEATKTVGGATETYGVMTWNPIVFMLANGATGLVQNDGKWSVKLSDKAAITGLQMVRDLSADGSYSFTNGSTEFIRRQTAMVIGPPGNTIYGNDTYRRMKDQIGMVPLPKGPDASSYYAPVGTDGYFVPMYAKNPLGGVAYIYEFHKEYYNALEVSNAPEDIEFRDKTMSKEHRAIRDEYVKNATPIFSHLDGLSGWWDGENNRYAFWKKIIVEQSNPMQVIDSMNSIVLSCLKKTVGSVNVK